MSKEKKETYKVEIYEYETGKTATVIGRGLSKRKADKREVTGLLRCNSNYGCRTIKELPNE